MSSNKTGYGFVSIVGVKSSVPGAADILHVLCLQLKTIKFQMFSLLKIVRGKCWIILMMSNHFAGV